MRTLAVGAHISLDERCAPSPDGRHCDHWYDGETCGYCKAAPLDNDKRTEQGMEPYDPELDPHA